MSKHKSAEQKLGISQSVQLNSTRPTGENLRNPSPPTPPKGTNSSNQYH